MKPSSLDEIMKNIDWSRWVQIIVPLMQPLLIFGAWLSLSKIDKRADAVSKLIAIAEPIPTIDLNVPKPVVLASLYHSIEDAMEMIESLVDVIGDIPDALRDLITKIKDEIPTKEDILPEELSAYLQALKDCNDNAKKFYSTSVIPYNLFTAIPWIQSCMLQKGRSVSVDWIRKNLANL